MSLPSGLAEFVDTRGAALFRTASLLELDEDVAAADLVSVLGAAAPRWESLERDGGAELELRTRLYRSVLTRLRSSDAWNRTAEPGEEGDGGPPVSLERRCLARLTNRERVVLTLRHFEALTSGEVGRLMSMSSTDVDLVDADASDRFRTWLNLAPGSSLLASLNAAALREPPDRLADRAMEQAPRGRRRLLAAAGVAALAVAAVVVVASPDASDDEADQPAVSSDQNIEAWGIPSQFPGLKGLPSLGSEPIEQASAAYIVGGVPVVTDAATGSARTVLGGERQPQWFDNVGDGPVRGLLERGPLWTQAVLSPDGEWLLLVQANADGLQRPGDLYLLRIDSLALSPVPGARPAARPQGDYGIADTVLAWSPGVGAFACICGGQVKVFDLEPGGSGASFASSFGRLATDVAWGAEGIVARVADGRWIALSGGSELGRLGAPDAVAVSQSSPTVYVTSEVTSIYAIGGGPEPDGGRCVWWDADFATPVPITPVPDRDGELCTPIAMQPGRAGVLLTVRPVHPRPQGLPADVVLVDEFGSSTVIGGLPPGTTMASYAARSVG